MKGGMYHLSFLFTILERLEKKEPGVIFGRHLCGNFMIWI